MSVVNGFPRSNLRGDVAVASDPSVFDDSWRVDPAYDIAANEPQIVLSFDVEEHFRIEAASGLSVDAGLKAHYAGRVDVSTRWILAQLAEHNAKATFFVVGQLARDYPALVHAIHRAGHEIASHGWDHQRVHNFTAASFREDVRRSKDALEQVTGEVVVGYRAPTFSIVRQTAWAIDVLAELGMEYDSSIFPVWHDRYGIPRAPRVPFLALGESHTLLELPLATLRFFGSNLPVAGGGYFRLLPRFFLKTALWQLCRATPAVATLYFHPWEFDPDQARLPLRRLSSFRTYVGLGSSREKLRRLLASRKFSCAREVARSLRSNRNLSSYSLARRGK